MRYRRRAEVRRAVGRDHLGALRGPWCVELREDYGTFDRTGLFWFGRWKDALAWAIRAVGA